MDFTPEVVWFQALWSAADAQQRDDQWERWKGVTIEDSKFE
jgi:hypothetical protein